MFKSQLENCFEIFFGKLLQNGVEKDDSFVTGIKICKLLKEVFFQWNITVQYSVYSIDLYTVQYIVYTA